MHIEHEGETYKVVFHHDVPTDWEFHAGHQIALQRPEHTAKLRAPVKDGDRNLKDEHGNVVWHTVERAVNYGHATLVCVTCQDDYKVPVLLSRVGTSLAKSQLDYGTAVAYMRETARNTHCFILKRGDKRQMTDGYEWTEVARGVSRLNWQAGDTFNPDAGRTAALHDALNPTIEVDAVLKRDTRFLPRPFKTVVWDRYMRNSKRRLAMLAAAKARRAA